jgi:hypothetical protein
VATNEKEKDAVSSNRVLRINRLSARKAAHDEKIRQTVRKRKLSIVRRERKRPGELADIVAYDLETTRIKAGTPEPLYVTAFADHRNYILSTKCVGVSALAEIMREHWLTDEFNGCKFVAWNGNNYDVYFVALAAMEMPEFIVRPYLTKGKSLRGLRILPKEDLHLKPNQQRSWEFVDGISMLGLQGKTLKDFLKTFAPEYQKHERDSFDEREFDPEDPTDVEYAFRDSEGLYWGMQYAQEIVFERFQLGLRTTIGNLGIKLFEMRIPEAKRIVEPSIQALGVLRDYVCRGGYCHLMRRFRGRVWKYDLNQAYAAAMREADLPAGDCRLVKGESKYSKCFIARVDAFNPKNKIPFYCRVIDPQGRIRSLFATTKMENTWLTSSEIEQLRAEGWKLNIYESFVWYDHFNMKEYVDGLEQLRASAPGGPSGAVGTMIKAIGNNSYGKTLEQLEPLELVLAKEQPPGFVDYHGEENPNVIPYVWCRLIDTPTKNYHQPQIGAFITAHVRMVIRRAALLAPDDFLYADTDCVIYSKDMTKQLDIDSRRYGAFKLEESGSEYLLIAKKVYASVDFKTKHSKGLRVKELTFDDFVHWYEGTIPAQQQVQRQNFVKFLHGSDMFVNRTRKGTAV